MGNVSLFLQLSLIQVSARAVRFAESLGDKTLQTQPAPFLEDLVAVGLKRFDIDEGLGRILEKTLQQTHAIPACCPMQVIIVEIQQIERVVAHMHAAPSAELAPELLKIRQTG